MSGSVGRDEHFNAVVIGSGFGGSVAAYRLAEAGQQVCVLERGKAYPPGSFARSPHDLGQAFWDPSRGLQGLFNVWSFRGIEALVSSGLGGGSLIYANVLLRKDERWFVHDQAFTGGYEHWPISRADLEPHYKQVEDMIGFQQFPLDSPGYAAPKTIAMREAAKGLGLDWQLPNLAVTFAANDTDPPAPGEPIAEPTYGNIHGLPRTTCQLCGECDIGCNYGAKNTLDHTYLSAAQHYGADIRIRCEVKRIAPRPGGGYTVSYVEHRPEAEGTKTDTGRLPLVTVTADRLILAAGSIGSTYLLLRNQAAFPGLSSAALGTRFSGNGDLLGFILRSKRRLPTGQTTGRLLDSSRGPVITSAMRMPDAVDAVDGKGATGRGFYIQDAGYPQFVNWVVEGTQLPGSINRFIRFAARRIWSKVTGDPRSDLGAEISSLLGKGALSSTSMALLGMGRDVPDGRMKLRGRKAYLDVDWTTETSEEYFSRLRSTMVGIADQLDGEFQDNPLSWLKRVITTHPLGGCPMGRHDREGVVDQWGQVFGHEGFYILDGSTMPGPTGSNPALTIAAFANRAIDEMLTVPLARQIRPAATTPIKQQTPANTISTGPTATTAATNDATITTLAFTEEMKGYVTLGATDFHEGFRQGKRDGTFCMFHLTITAVDVERFIRDREHEGVAEGWVQCDALGGRLPVEKGVFNLFVDDKEPGRTWMRYRLFFADSAGNPLTLKGFKDVHDDPGFDLWSDTSTLYTHILGGHVEPADDEKADVVAAGIINIYIQDFAKQLTTFRTTGPSLAARASAFSAFGKLFLGKLWELYAPLAKHDAGGDT